MKKIKLQISSNWISGFVSNLLSVVIGIALTLGISSMIQNHAEKKDEQQMMALVKNELNKNKNRLKDRKGIIGNDFYAYEKILKNKGNWENIPSDSLIEWIDQSRHENIELISTSSWDIFKNSDIIAKHTDKYLIRILDECYFCINATQEKIRNYYEKKSDSYKSIYIMPDYNNPAAYLNVLVNNKDATFFLENSLTSNFDIRELISIAETAIDYALYLINEEGYHLEDVAKKSGILSFNEFSEKLNTTEK